MAEPLFSASWYRVEALKPRLASQLKVVRQPVRDQVWHVLIESVSGRQMRLNPVAWEFAARCDGTHTVAELWNLLLERLGEGAPTQDDIVRLLGQLYRSGMLQFDSAPHLSMLFAEREQQGRARRRAFINPLLLRIRLFDPSRVLDRLEPLARPLFSRAGLVAWALCVGLALLACLANFAQLKAEAATLAATPRMLWLAWLCYPVIKAIHEFGHALAVRRFGGAVHEMGITLLFFTPAPYVDASAANAFERRGQRMAVSAAGIMVELFLASIAAAFWFTVAPGHVRDVALVTLLICSVSTLVFNGNPLLRLDGYYVLSDALDLPNLAARSSAWCAAWAQRLVRGADAVPHTVLARGELKWLVMYAPLSWLYRLLLLFALIGWVGAHSWLLGWVAVVLLVGWLLLQGGATLLQLAAGAASPGMRARVASLMGAALLAVLVLLFAVPAPSVVVARGVVWPPERAQLRPAVSGFIATTPVADGAQVQPGDVLMTLSEPALTAERDRRAAQLAGLQAQQYQALLSDPARAADLAEDIARNEAEVARAEQQLSQLEVRGQLAGRLVLPKPGDLTGSHARRGAMLGYILPDEADAPANVRAVLDEQDALIVRNRVRGVQVRLADAPAQALPAVLTREVPAAARELPSAALGERRGGPFAMDPADKDGLRTREPVFVLDVSVPTSGAVHVPDRIGTRAWVRFDLGYEPLGLQWLRRARQLLLRQFNPTGQV